MAKLNKYRWRELDFDHTQVAHNTSNHGIGQKRSKEMPFWCNEQFGFYNIGREKCVYMVSCMIGKVPLGRIDQPAEMFKLIFSSTKGIIGNFH
jgi:hypothetical protein